jgi:hypothetical protein
MQRMPRWLNEGGRKRMEKRARSLLWRYGIAAKRQPQLWAQALKWAEQIANSYSYRQHWPLDSELAVYFLLLVWRDLVQTHSVKRLPVPIRPRGSLSAELPQLPLFPDALP